MGFWDDFALGLKDVGTTATRIVTDTAVDIGDVVTGFQFSDKMNDAKRKMSDAGVLSAADAIQKNHYPEIKRMESTAQSHVSRIEALFREGQAEQALLERDMQTLADMCADVALLSVESLEAEKLLSQAQSIPNWERWSAILDLGPDALKVVTTVGAASRRWETIGRDLATTGMVVSAGSGLAALVALGALSKSRSLGSAASLARVGAHSGAKASAKVGEALAKSAKFLKIGKIAGRASGALAVITVGLDIGLSVAELEAKKSQLEDQLRQLAADLNEAETDLAGLRAEREGVAARIRSLLQSVKPPPSLGGWSAWVDATRDALRDATRRLVSVSGIVASAEKRAEQTRGEPFERRARHVAAVDPDISIDEAGEIIARVDQAAGLADPRTLDPRIDRIAALVWRAEGPSPNELEPSPTHDMLSFTYGPTAGDEAERWTILATAPWSRAFRLAWRYGAAHTPAATPARLLAFADGPQGRGYVALVDGAPPPLTSPASGEATLTVHAGQAFGFVLSVGEAGSSEGLRAICGTYSRKPVENDWHVGVIAPKDDEGVVLQWTNRAGVSWDLLPHLASDQLLKTPGSPYQDAYPGSNAFAIRRTEGRVDGFEFIGELYGRDGALTGDRRRGSGPRTGVFIITFTL